MPGTTVLGESSLTVSTLPPEARALKRFFRLLDKEEMRTAMIDVLETHFSSNPKINGLKENFKSTYDRLKLFESRKDRKFEQRLAQGVNAAVEFTFEDDHSLENEKHLECDISLESPKKRARTTPASIPGDPSQDVLPINSMGGNDLPTTSPNILIPQSFEARSTTNDQSIAVVTEASACARDQEETTKESRYALTMKSFWTTLIEGMHLQVISRTTQVWGRKKIYEIYRLQGTAACTKSMEQLRQDVRREFSESYCGAYPEDRDCRAYAKQSDGFIYLFLAIGKPYDFRDERNRASSGEKKKKKGNEFVFIVKPGANLVAVSASRAPSRSPLSKFALTAFDLAMRSPTDAVIARSVVYEPPSRVSDYRGTEPMELLKEAEATERGEATGRFATFATNDTQEDPLSELQTISTGALVDRSGEQTRLNISSDQGRKIAQIGGTIASNYEGASLTSAATRGVVVNHSATDQKSRHESRAEAFGEGGLVRKKMRFQWSGETSAPSVYFKGEESKAKLKCVVTLKGSDVFEGLRELVDLGIMKAPIKDFLRDSASAASSTIRVQNGTIMRRIGQKVTTTSSPHLG